MPEKLLLGLTSGLHTRPHACTPTVYIHISSCSNDCQGDSHKESHRQVVAVARLVESLPSIDKVPAPCHKHGA